jgi:hypothetical protein
MIDFARNKKFPKNTLIFGNKTKSYTAVLNFFDFIICFDEKPSSSIEFKCKSCELILKSPIGNFSNLNKHLKEHQVTKQWYFEYIKQSSNSTIAVLSDEYFDLIKYFISSNSSFIELKNPSLRRLISAKISIPSIKTFRYTILPKVLEHLYNAINYKLKTAYSITLIVDLWTSKIKIDYLAVAAQIINELHDHETLVIGMEVMDGTHSAENIKMPIERILKRYDQSCIPKIRGIINS